MSLPDSQKSPRVGRRNSYSIRLDLKLRHPLEAHHSIGELLKLLSRP
ncbi:MAG UNVERIFIED_CONTAM: hypothetical protein LVR18_39575 [Planctomycetaceae bacterium]